MGLKEENLQWSAEGSKGGSRRSWGYKYELIKMHSMNSYRINKIEEKGIFQESYYVMPYNYSFLDVKLTLWLYERMVGRSMIKCLDVSERVCSRYKLPHTNILSLHTFPNQRLLEHCFCLTSESYKPPWNIFVFISEYAFLR